MKTVKIESTDKKTQGDFVIINEEDFNSKEHKLYSEGKESKTPPKAPAKTPPKGKKNQEPKEIELVFDNDETKALFEDAGLTVEDVTATGENGVVTEDDVLKAVEAKEDK